MRIIGVILLAAVLGTAVGAAVAYVEVRPGASAMSNVPASPVKLPADGSAPRVDVEESTYNFGNMQRGTRKSHEFQFRNIGKSPLTLSVGSTSCKCTVGEVPKQGLAPGETVPVKLEWRALVNPGQFRQTATILTNDPVESRVELSVEGEVTEASGVVPHEFMFDKVPAGDAKSAEVYVMALTQDVLEVGEPKLLNAETQKYFDVQVEKVDRETLPTPLAKDGVKITVTTKRGLPLGRFDGWLTVSTNIKDAESLEIPIFGRVIGNISVHGHFWDEDRSALRLGRVKSEDGIRAPLNIVIRGEGADQVKLTVDSTDPSGDLIATLGEPKLLKPTLVHVPLTVEIRKDAPPMARLNTAQSEPARIVIKTTQEKAPEMVLHVEFVVER